MYETYGDNYDGWNDDSFINDEILTNKLRENTFNLLVKESKQSAGNFGQVTIINKKDEL